jgi:signal transduction histidine kinase
VVCLDGEIRQVLNNLVGNAIDAMAASGGRLLLRSREGTNWTSGAKGVVFTVADTGSGMRPETVARMFEPFFTTKGLSGTGLGLWVSHDIVQRHHGKLRVKSTSKQGQSGTVFTLFLPFDSSHLKRSDRS